MMHRLHISWKTKLWVQCEPMKKWRTWGLEPMEELRLLS